MPFLVVGVEHKTSPLPIREAVTMNLAAVARASAELRATPAIDEVAILSTCNRTEIYLFVNEPVASAAAATSLLTAYDERVVSYLRTWEEMDAVEHLFRVACGLESQALGEAQILSQVRETLDTGQRLGSVGPILHSLFRSAISCARQARAGTALGRLGGSLATEAVAAARQELGSLANHSVLLIGGGEISRLLADELRGALGTGTLFVVNRTEAVAVELAGRVGGRAARVADLPRVLSHVDVVFSATSAPHYMLTPEDLPLELASRSVPLHIYDLALPRDVDPAVSAEAGVVVHDLDDLLPRGIADHWREDILTMEAVMAVEVREFTVWYLTRRVAPVISNLRSHVEAVSRQELQRAAPHLRDLTDRERAAVDSLTERLIDKMFHHLVTRLRLAAQTDPKLVDAAEFLFLHGEGGLYEHAAHLAESGDRSTLSGERSV